MVLMNDVGCVTLKEQGAVHVHQALGVPLPAPIRSVGSPGSAVSPTLDPTVIAVSPVRLIRLAKLSFVGGKGARPTALNVTGLPEKVPVAVAFRVLGPIAGIQLPTVATPEALVVA